MATLGFTTNDTEYMDKWSSVPEQTTYEDGDYTALFQTVNTFGAMYNRGKFENASVDMQQYADREFSTEALQEDLTQKGYSPEVITQTLMNRPSDWATAERRANYYKDVFTKEQQVAENFSTAGMLAASLPMAIFDVDSLVTTPMVAGALKLTKMANLATTASKVAAHAATGAAVGATSMLVYEAATGVYRDDSLINSALIGAALGGTLGYVVERSANNAALIKTTDSEGRVKTPEEEKLELLANTSKERDEVDSIITQYKETKQNLKGVETDLKESRSTDKGVQKFNDDSDRAKLVRQREASKQEYHDSVASRNQTGKELSRVTMEIKELTTKIESTTNSIKSLANEASVAKLLKKESAPIKGQLTEFKNQIAKLEGKTDEASVAKMEELGQKIDAQTKKLKIVEAKMRRSATEVRRHPENPEDLLSEYKVNQKYLEKKHKQLQSSLELSEKKVKRTKEAHRKSIERVKGFEKYRKGRDAPRKSFATMSLEEKAAKYKADLSPEGIKKLLEERNLLDSDLAKMDEGDFNLKTLRGIRKTKQNYVDKLAKELDEIGKVKDFRQSDTFKKLPDWAQKLIISPVEKLLNSKNDFVSGYTSKLFSGTLHHGKINSLTAWVIRYEMDVELNRMHKALRNSYRQAIKEGYTGKIEDFEKEAAKNSFAVTGNIQRQLYTGIPGDVIGKAREEIARSRVGSVKKIHSSDNKWVQQATEDYLAYYEKIHGRGKSLGIESFMTSMGKGYINRSYSKDKIEKLEYNGLVGREAAIELITDAQKAFATSVGSEVTPSIMAEFRGLAKGAVDGTLDASFRKESLVKPLGAPKQSTTSSLKQRTIDAFDDHLLDVLEDDMVGNSVMYGLRVHGRLALKEAIGVHKDEDIANQLAHLKEQGATQKELDNLTVLIDTIKGTREISTNPYDPFTRAVKMASTYTSAMHTLAFAIPTVTELASISKEFGWGKTIDRLVGSPKEVYNIYRNGTTSDKNTIELMVTYGDSYFGHKVNRVEAEGGLQDIDRIEKFVTDVVHKESVYGGLLPLTDMMKMTTASLSVDFMAKLSVAKNISKTDRMRLQDMGFDIEDLPLIKDTLQVQPDGRIANMDRKTWGTLDRKITAGVVTMVERTILHPNGATLPKFMTNMEGNAIVPRIFAKFMRFPVESYERLLLRGIQEADAKQLIALGSNIGMWTAILTMKDAMREDDKKKYVGEDGMQQLMIDSFLYNSFTSLPIAALDTASGLITGDNLTNDYKYSVGGAVWGKITDLQKAEPRISLPFYNLNIGDTFIQPISDMMGLEELNRE